MKVNLYFPRLPCQVCQLNSTWRPSSSWWPCLTAIWTGRCPFRNFPSCSTTFSSGCPASVNSTRIVLERLIATRCKLHWPASGSVYLLSLLACLFENSTEPGVDRSLLTILFIVVFACRWVFFQLFSPGSFVLIKRLSVNCTIFPSCCLTVCSLSKARDGEFYN